jgi:hypothetical protein
MDWTSGTASGNAGSTQGGSDGWTNAQAVYCGNQYSLYCFGTTLTNPVTITKQMGRLAFVSKGSFSPGSGASLTTLDTMCKSEAANAGLPSPANFLAFIAVNGASAASRFSTTGANWVRPDGIPLATSVANLLASQLIAAPSVHADGTYLVTTPPYVWTGASDPNTAGTNASTCNSWGTNASSVVGDIGASWSAATQWFNLNNSQFPCNNPPVQVYCFQN